MAAGTLNHSALAAGSVADDLGYIALATSPVYSIPATDYRVIGRLMVTALAYWWDLWQHRQLSGSAFRGA